MSLALNLGLWANRASGGGGPAARVVFVGVGDSLVPGRDNLNSARNVADDPFPTNAAQFSNNNLAPLPFQQISTNAGPIYFPEAGSEVGRISPLERMMIDYQAAAGGTVGVIPLAVGGSSLQVSWNVSTGTILAARTAEHNLAMTRFAAFDGVTPIVGAVVINVGSNDNAAESTIRGWLEGLIAHIRANFSGVTATTPIILGGPVKGPDNNTNPLGWGYRRLYAEIASEQDNVFLMHPPYPTANVDNLHPTLSEGRTWGANLAIKARQALTGTEPFPTFSVPNNPETRTGIPAAIPLTHTGLSLASPYGVPVITGGADAALFEIGGTFFAPILRMAGNGNAPSVGNYEVEISIRNNAGQLGSATLFTVEVVAEVSPATFFASGELGQVWDLSDLSNLSQTIDGLTPVTATGQSVGWVRDISGNNNHWIAPANDTRRPTYQVDADGKAYLQFDGSNDVMFASPFVTSGNRTWTVSMGIFGAAQASTRIILSNDNSTTNTPFATPLQTDGTTTNLSTNARNDASSGVTPLPILTGQLDSTKRVITSIFEGSNARLRLRNAASRPSGGGDGSYTQTTIGTFGGTLTVNRSTLGALGRGTPSNFFNGRVYSGFAINRVLTTNEIRDGEDWAASRQLTAPLP